MIQGTTDGKVRQSSKLDQGHHRIFHFGMIQMFRLSLGFGFFRSSAFMCHDKQVTDRTIRGGILLLGKSYWRYLASFWLWRDRGQKRRGHEQGQRWQTTETTGSCRARKKPKAKQFCCNCRKEFQKKDPHTCIACKHPHSLKQTWYNLGGFSNEGAESHRMAPPAFQQDRQNCTPAFGEMWLHLIVCHFIWHTTVLFIPKHIKQRKKSKCPVLFLYRPTGVWIPLTSEKWNSDMTR